MIVIIFIILLFEIILINNDNTYSTIDKTNLNSNSSSVSISNDKNYEYLVNTSERNNRIICVKKEYNDLIYYVYDNQCDPQNTFTFSFNSTFKFDEDFYLSYKKNKESFIKTKITPNLAIGSCISCFFLDEMNLLSIYGYTFIYKNSSETEYKNYYKNIIDINYNLEKTNNSLYEISDSKELKNSDTVISQHNNILKDNNEDIKSWVYEESNSQWNTNAEDTALLYSNENLILQKFLKENRIHYAYDEIGKSKLYNTFSDNMGSQNKNSLNEKMMDDFFIHLKERENNYNKNNLTLFDDKNVFDLKKLKNIIFNNEECKFLKEDINKKKIWSNIIFASSFTNLKVLSHINNYSGTYEEFRHFSFDEDYKKRKINDFISITLDLNNKEYLNNNNIFILIANDEIKFLNKLNFCSNILSNDPSVAYIKNLNVITEYKDVKNKYISTNADNIVFLIKVLYYNNDIHLFLIDDIRGFGNPMKLSVPFFFLISHSYFSEFTHFFLKDNIIGWIKRNKILYVKTMNKIFTYLKESTIYSNKTYDVITIENKMVSNIYLLYLSHHIFKYIIFARYNPLKNYSLHKNINFEAVLLNMISNFTNEELANYKIYFEKVTKKEITNLTDKKKIQRMDVFDIFVIPSVNYVKFQNVLSKLFKALFDCGGRHISKLLKIVILRSHYDMLYNFNCYNYQLYSFLINFLDLHEYFYEYTDLNDLFKESQKILIELVKLVLEEMNNLIPFNEDKNLIKYLIIILYFGNDMFCLDKENSIYIQLIYELRHLNVFHAIILAYLSGDKLGTLCMRKNEIEASKSLEIDSKFNYDVYDDDNIYLKYGCPRKCDINDYSSIFLKKFQKKYFGDFHVAIRSANEYTLGIILVSFMASVVFIVGELDKELKRIYVYRIFKNIFIKNYVYNITKYYTFWNGKLYAFEQYEPECILLFNKYNLYEKYYFSNIIGDSLKVYNLHNLKNYKVSMLRICSGNRNLNNNDDLINYFSVKRDACLCDKNMINQPKSDFVVSEYLQLRYNFMKKMKRRNHELYEKMLNYNFFNDPLNISYKTKNFQNEKMINICKDIKFEKNHLCLFHKSRIILTYLYLLSSSPDLIFYVVSPLIYIKPHKHCDAYDIPLILNNMLKNRNFYKKSAKICINYAFAHFISVRDKISNLVITAKISGTMVNVSKRNLLLLLPLSKRVDILDYSKNNEYDIKEEILNEYFILGNPYTPINIISYRFQDYDEVKKNSHVTISGAFIKQYDEKYVTYKSITRKYNKKLQCTENHAFEINGRVLCFCNILSNDISNNCLYPFCEQSKKFCYENEECIDGKCVCVDGYSRNPMSYLCEKNNECMLQGEDTCEDPGYCVLAKNRYICLCPFPYVRVLKTCLHPLKGIKIGLYVFNNFENEFSNDEDDAPKKEKFYTNVFGSMSEYIKAAINYIIEPDLKSRIYVQPIKKMKNGIKATIIIYQRVHPNEPTPIEIFNNFLNQLSDSTSALNNGFYSYFARFTYIEYVVPFSKNEGLSPFNQNLIKYIPSLFIKILEIDMFNDISIIACFNFIILIVVTLLLLLYFLYLFIKIKFFQNERVKAF
ncbi:conserved Plasmodium protein, unknown function [Plasmodium gallinaceum]|uniref:EGF-like domain-containing protein n=1 Tax=Plasmodium gallinaceum TaxID=5849 RepID=A0A1J1H0C3_PLAGA|nr:conserved Plasmodium protein, unknown function [Plasmodium gallinaceum]CRG96732.1 conserved Plasmodium protein, unknown function [Plasmodium gallinaceum]